jgi:hypothetical protein
VNDIAARNGRMEHTTRKDKCEESDGCAEVGRVEDDTRLCDQLMIIQVMLDHSMSTWSKI